MARRLTAPAQRAGAGCAGAGSAGAGAGSAGAAPCGAGAAWSAGACREPSQLRLSRCRRGGRRRRFARRRDGFACTWPEDIEGDRREDDDARRRSAGHCRWFHARPGDCRHRNRRGRYRSSAVPARADRGLAGGAGLNGSCPSGRIRIIFACGFCHVASPSLAKTTFAVTDERVEQPIGFIGKRKAPADGERLDTEQISRIWPEHAYSDCSTMTASPVAG